jgi:heme-degrading monooxygenase HmoA
MGAVRVTLTMTVPPASAGAFEAAWSKVASFAEADPACLRQALTRVGAVAGDGAGAETVGYTITSDWAERAAFHAFETSSAQDRATAELRALRTSAAMTVAEIVEHRDRRP